MNIQKFFVFSVAIALFAINCSGGSKDAAKIDFPKKEISYVVPYDPGGGTDVTARALAEASKEFFKQPVNIINKPGASGAVGMADVAVAKPDGYTVLAAVVELITLPHMNNLPFTYKSFKPVMQYNAAPAAITINAKSPINTLEEFLVASETKTMKIGNSGTGAIWHLATLAFEKETGLKYNSVPFNGAAPAITALLGNHIDAVSVSAAEVLSQVRAGQLKVLAVMSDTRLADLPDVPTLKEKGIDLSIGTWRGVAVPKETPDDIVTVLEDGFIKAANTPSFIEFMQKSGNIIEILNSKEFLAKMEENDKIFAEITKNLK